jgi:rSAM/selenodomain-associated transferase 1
VALLVIAKAPLPGRAKTRLCPPCTPEQAAALAEASLLDTLHALGRTPTHRRVIVFDGDGDGDGSRWRWRPAGFELIPQRGDGLAERLAAAFEDVGGPALLVGMDTPQLTARHLAAGIAALRRPDVDAVLGPAPDGGYWSIGLKRPNWAVFAGIEMSVETTCAQQRARIEQLGLRLDETTPLRDIDTIEDARAVARAAPRSRFARTFAATGL